MLGEFFSMRRTLAHNDIYWNNVAVHKVGGLLQKNGFANCVLTVP